MEKYKKTRKIIPKRQFLQLNHFPHSPKCQFPMLEHPKVSDKIILLTLAYDSLHQIYPYRAVLITCEWNSADE